MVRCRNKNIKKKFILIFSFLLVIFFEKNSFAYYKLVKSTVTPPTGVVLTDIPAGTVPASGADLGTIISCASTTGNVVDSVCSKDFVCRPVTSAKTDKEFMAICTPNNATQYCRNKDDCANSDKPSCLDAENVTNDFFYNKNDITFYGICGKK